MSAPAARTAATFLKCCVNGPRHPREHPALPATPEALARESARAVAAGADALHLHPKDADGVDTLDPDAVAAAITAVREAVPASPVGTTTGAWTVADPTARAALVTAWTVLPDFASVNWHEPGTEEVAAALLERGIGIEAGLWHLDAVEAWLASPHRDRCLRVLIELPDGLDEAGTRAEADRLFARVRTGLAPGVPVLLHGEGSSTWPALRRAVELGLQARIGLEDVLTLPDGRRAADNAALVAAARALCTG